MLVFEPSESTFERTLDPSRKRLSKMKAHLEVITNIAVLLVALVVLGNFAWIHLAKQPVPRVEGGLRKGDAFSLLPGVDYSKSAQTLIIALSSRCEHCNESVPFFRQVLQATLEGGDKTRIVDVFPETADEVSRYVLEQQLGVKAIPGINFKALNLPGTPSVVLVSNEGKVLDFWIGKPSKDAEKEILDSVRHNT